MTPRRRPRLLGPLVLAASLPFAALSAGAQTNTILVSPVAGDPIASGTALLNALAGITTNSISNRYVIKIEPGIYNLQTSSLQMKEWVDIEGSGRDETLIRGQGNSAAEGVLRGIVQGADNSELRDLTVRADSDVDRTLLIPILNVQTSPRFRNIHTVALSGEQCWGIRNVGGSPEIDTVTVETSNCSFVAYGIVNAAATGGGHSTIRHTRISAINSPTAYGLWNDSACVPLVVRDVEIRVGGTGSHHTGVYVEGQPQSIQLTIANSVIQVPAGDGTNQGLEIHAILTVNIDSTKVTAVPGLQSFGIDSDVAATIVVRNSFVRGDTNTINAPAAIVRVGASQLPGGPVVAGLPACASVFDENFTNFPSTCP